MNNKLNNPLSTFSHPQFGQIRVVEKEGEPWFVAKDVASALGYMRTADAIRDHCKGVGETTTPSAGGNQTVKIIPEADLYRLIMRSKLPHAERFQDWVVEEVLPSIRKHGAYMTPGTVTAMMQKPENLIALVEKLHDEQVKRIAAETVVAENAPKVECYDRFLSEGADDYPMAIISNRLQQEGKSFGLKKLFEYLRQQGVLCSKGSRRNLPTQRYMEKGWFKVIAPPTYADASWKPTLRVTARGVAEITKRIHDLLDALGDTI